MDAERMDMNAWRMDMNTEPAVKAALNTDKVKRAVILDCDNTYGVDGKDVDDGLALLYLLGCRDIDLIGVTCSFGNSDQDTVYGNTVRFLKELGREDIPVYKGAYASYREVSDASEFLASAAARSGGHLSIVCTGSVSNLLGAAEADRDFFSNIEELSMMGGLTEPLFVGGKPMRELNFSCDSEASYRVLTSVRNLKIACASNCLDSFFPASQLKEQLDARPCLLSDYLRSTLKYWYDINQSHWNLDGIINWDVMAAAQLVHPELFTLEQTVITPSPESLKAGLLSGGGSPVAVVLPVIRDKKEYTSHVYDTYFSAVVSPLVPVVLKGVEKNE